MIRQQIAKNLQKKAKFMRICGSKSLLTQTLFLTESGILVNSFYRKTSVILYLGDSISGRNFRQKRTRFKISQGL